MKYLIAIAALLGTVSAASAECHQVCTYRGNQVSCRQVCTGWPGTGPNDYRHTPDAYLQPVDQRCTFLPNGRQVCVDMNNGVPDPGGQRCDYLPDGRQVCVDTRR